MWRGSALALALVALVGSSPAGAQARRATVRWEAPEGCPAPEDFLALVGEVAHRGTARVVVAQQASGAWTAWVVVDGSLRELAGGSCQELAAAAALVVAIGLRAIEERGLADAPAAPPVPALVTTAPPPLAGSDAAVERSLAAPRSVPATWSAGTGIGAEVGALPGAAAVVRVSLGLRGRRLAAEVDGSLASGQTGAMQGELAVVTRVRLLAAGARLCGGGSWAWFCAGVEAGTMTAAADNGFARASGDGPWISGRAGPELVLAVARDWDLLVQAEVGAPLVYPRFTVNQVPVHDPGGLSFRSCLGIQRRFR